MAHADVLFLTRNAILALDLEQALSAGGFTATRDLSKLQNVRAVVADLDELKNAEVALLAEVDPSRTPLILIGEIDRATRKLTSVAAATFDKPVSVDHVVTRLGRLLKCQAHEQASRLSGGGPGLS